MFPIFYENVILFFVFLITMEKVKAGLGKRVPSIFLQQPQGMKELLGAASL